jgi:hypothetical protein
VLANWIGTGDTLWNTLAAGYWPVAGLDLALIVAAIVAMFAARRLRRRELGVSNEATTRDASLNMSEAGNA